MKNNEQSLRDLWDIIKNTDIFQKGIDKGAERIFEEKMVKNFPV